MMMIYNYKAGELVTAKMFDGSIVEAVYEDCEDYPPCEHHFLRNSQGMMVIAVVGRESMSDHECVFLGDLPAPATAQRDELLAALKLSQTLIDDEFSLDPECEHGFHYDACTNPDFGVECGKKEFMRKRSLIAATIAKCEPQS